MAGLEQLQKLQNGSDVRGVALADESGAPVTLTGAVANQIAAAFGIWLGQKLAKQPGKLRVGIGHDSRLTAQPLKEEMVHGLCGQGVQVLDCGLASTPAMFMGTVFEETSFDGSIMITASHLPKNRNGMKFFTKDGGLNNQDIAAVLRLAAEIAPATVAGSAQMMGLIGLYAASLREKIVAGVQNGEKPLAGLHIVVDAGNGAGGFFVQQVLLPLGANCNGSLFLKPDGHFPNHQPNPENREAMDAIRGAVVQNGANLGIIFDTDVDRMSAVLADGSAVNRDAIIAIMSAILAPECPGSTIVTDSVTSDRLTVFLEGELGLVHRRFKRGYKNVINEAMRLNRAGTQTPLAIETSGHGALKENYFLDDGAYMAVRLIIAAARAKAKGEDIAALIAALPAPGFEKELRLPLLAQDFAAYGNYVLETFKNRARQQGLVLANTQEGVRLSFPGKGWLLLRLSLHDPLMPLNAEGTAQQDLVEILQTAAQLLEGLDNLDTSALYA